MTAFAKLSHAYGKASDVPTLLRDLAATDAKKRGRALSQLSASICHQGTFYSATPATVPHLVALLEDPKVKGKDGVLALLADLATLDEPERFCLTGAAPAVGPRGRRGECGRAPRRVQPKDNWGGRREKYADPHLVAYLEVLRAAKQDAAACEQALAKLRG